MFRLMKKLGKYLETPKYIIRRVTQACGDIARCQGFKALRQSPSLEPTRGRNQNQAVAPRLSHQLIDPTLEKRTG